MPRQRRGAAPAGEESPAGPVKRRRKAQPDSVPQPNGTTPIQDDPPQTPPAGSAARVALGVCTSAAELAPQSVQWLWPGWIAYETVSLIVGPVGSGKTSLLCLLAAQQCGTGIPALAPTLDKSDVLYYVSEMSPATMLRPRLKVAGANLARVHFPGYDPAGRLLERLSLPSGIEQLRQRILKYGARLVLIDPIQSVLDPGCSPMASDAVRPLLELLAIVAVETRCAIVGAAHYRKGRSGSPLDWVAGSAAWTQASRSVLALGDHPREPGARVICSAKPGLGLPPRSRHYSLELESGDVVWSLGPPVDVTAEELGEARLAEGERDALADALRFLETALAGGGRPAKDVQDEAARACLSPITLRRAKERAGIRSVRHTTACGVEWYWELPQNPWDGDQ